MENTLPIIVLAVIFDQPDCIACRCKTLNEARCLPGTLEAICVDDVQIVIQPALKFIPNMRPTVIWTTFGSLFAP